MMKIKVGDNVKVLAGKDRGKEGKIIKIDRKNNKVVVEGINMVKKHMKPNRMNNVGSIVDIEAPIHVSNVKLAEVKKAAKAPKAEKVVKEAKAETKTTKKATTTKTKTAEKAKKASK